MKSGSDNYRESAVLDLIDLLKMRKIKINVYEPLIDQLEIDEVLLTNELEQFLDSSDLIIANRMSKDLVDVAYKVYSRDLFNEN